MISIKSKNKNLILIDTISDDLIRSTFEIDSLN